MSIQCNHDDGLFYRQTHFDKAKRVVIKVGSAVLTDANGINGEVIRNLAKQIAFLHDSGREVILVSSGAVAAGRQKLGVDFSKTLAMPEKQALAAVGQSLLMHAYDEAFEAAGQKIAQILLTHSDLGNRSRYLNVRNTIHSLFRYGVIPIINENDTVSVEELRFGDNDYLGALVCNLIDADMFICLTDVIGLYSGNPKTDPEARPIYTIAEINKEVEAMAGNIKSALGTGGMQSKIRAAKLVSSGGGSSFIGPGRVDNILQQLFSGEMIGTFFLPAKTKLPSRKHWIAHVVKPCGAMVLDKGACRAICAKGKSLLASGVVEVRGEFQSGDPVECYTEANEKIAVGLINYSHEEMHKIKGLKSDKIAQVLGYKDNDEVLHRDNLVILK